MKLGLVAAQMETNHQNLMAVARAIGAALGIEDEIAALDMTPPRVRQAEVGVIQQQQLVLNLLKRVREQLIVPETVAGRDTTITDQSDDALFDAIKDNATVIARIQAYLALQVSADDTPELTESRDDQKLQELDVQDEKPKRKVKA